MRKAALFFLLLPLVLSQASPVPAQGPVTADDYFNLGHRKQLKNDFDGAIVDYTKAIELDPRAAVAFYNRGLARHHQGDFDGAIADATEAIRLSPGFADAYYDRGTIRIIKGDLAGGKADHDKAIALNPKLLTLANGRNPRSAEDFNNRGIDQQDAIAACAIHA